MQPVLSILICSIQSRIGMLGSLLRNLDEQIERNNARGVIEVLIELDNKERSTGLKRQILLERSSGKRIVFADDDDELYDCYIEEMMKASESDADCFAINGLMTTNGINPIPWRISKDYENATVTCLGNKTYLRHTNHISPVRREIALQAGFPDKSNAEDGWYSNRLKGLLNSEYYIEKPVYHYKFSTHNKEYK